MTSLTKEHRKIETNESDSSVRSAEQFTARTQAVRDAVYDLLEFGRKVKAISDEDERSLTAGLADIRTEKDLENWERFVERGIASQRASYAAIAAAFEGSMTRANPYLSEKSKKDWEGRFARATFAEKKYFVHNQFHSFIDTWKKVHEERDELLKKPAMDHLTKEDIPELDVFKDAKAFKELSFREKKDLVAMVSGAILARNKFGNELYHAAKAKLERAAERGVLSKNKIGIWMERIFATRKDKATMEKFVRGSGKNSLDDLIMQWGKAAERFGKINGALEKKPGKAIGFRRSTLQNFLDMHYAQRISYLDEAERVLNTADNIDEENPVILEIRHSLDIGDWKGAEDALAEANQESLSGADRDRLLSMRRYLAQHRNDGGPRRIPSSSAEADAAWMEIQMVLQSELDPALQGLVRRLLPRGNFAINALRWTVYNYIWCHKNGFVNQEDSFENIENNIEATKERWEEEGDAGRNDVMFTQAYKRDEQKMLKGRKGDKAWIQYVNLTNENVMAGVADFYSKPHDPKVLYWTTFMGCRGTEPLDEGWHQRQLDALNKIRSASRTIEHAGGTYRSSGVKMPDTNTETS